MEREDALQRGLREMLGEIPPHDDRARRSTMAALSETPQRRYRWLPPLSGLLRRPFGVGVAAIVTLVAAVSILVAGPLRPSTAPGAPPTPIDPVSFSGQLVCTGSLAQSSEVEVIDMTEPRLSGAISYAMATDHERDLSSETPGVAAWTWRIDDGDGAWQGNAVSVAVMGETWSTVNFPLYGEGVYDGLVAHWELETVPNLVDGRCGFEVKGLIYEADSLPPAPEAVAP